MGEITRSQLPISVCHAPLRFGDVSIEAHVLDDETRLITTRGAVAALTGNSDGAGSGGLHRYIDRIPNKPADFGLVPIVFKIPGAPNGHGIDAMQFVGIAKLYADALVSGALHASQRPIGERCLRIIMALAGLAITTMIDEATGYHTRVTLNELERKYQLYLLPSPSEWERTFPEEFFREACTVFGVAFTPGRNPAFMPWFVRKFVYDAIDKDVAKEIKARNPNPRFGSNHHQHLSERVRLILNAHLARVTTVMRQSNGKDDFYGRFAHEFRGAGLQLQLSSGRN